MGSLITYEKAFSRKWFKAYSLILAGTFLVSVGYVFFISPYKIVPGGIYGISIVIHYMTAGLFTFAPDGLPIGIVALCFNVPLTLIALKVLGPRFGIKTFVGFILTSIIVDLLYVYNGSRPLVEGDALLSAIFGGAVIGLGVGLIFKSKASSGGSDVIAMMISKFTKMPVAQAMVIVDSCIVLLGLIAFGDWKIPLYSWVAIFVMGKMIDVVLQGISYDKTLFIISDKHEEIRDKILHDLNRGGTMIKAEGMFNRAEKTIIFCVVNRRELAILEEHISHIDPFAFMTVVDANEILGKGFKSLHEKVSE